MHRTLRNRSQSFETFEGHYIDPTTTLRTLTTTVRTRVAYLFSIIDAFRVISIASSTNRSYEAHHALCTRFYAMNKYEASQHSSPALRFGNSRPASARVRNMYIRRCDALPRFSLCLSLSIMIFRTPYTRFPSVPIIFAVHKRQRHFATFLHSSHLSSHDGAFSPLFTIRFWTLLFAHSYALKGLHVESNQGLPQDFPPLTIDQLSLS